MKCKKCTCVTKATSRICFACSVVIKKIQDFETSISSFQPLLGKRKNLKILKYKITKNEK